MTDSLLKEGERIDDLERNNLKIIQDPNMFCFGMDAVLLSSYAHVKSKECAIDLGCGGGIIPILLSAKTDGEHFTGIEIQQECADMANRSVKLNHLEDKIDIICSDLRTSSQMFKSGSFDVVTTNPPYMIAEHGLTNTSSAKTIARHEVCATLDDVLSQSAKLLRDGGRFYMVHRPFRLAQILHLMVNYKIEPKRMRLVYPFIDKEPNMVLIEGHKGGNSRITVEKPLIIYESVGVYTKEVHDMYGF